MPYDWKSARTRRLATFKQGVAVSGAGMVLLFVLLAGYADAQECQPRKTSSKITSCKEAVW